MRTQSFSSLQHKKFDRRNPPYVHRLYPRPVATPPLQATGRPLLIAEIEIETSGRRPAPATGSRGFESDLHDGDVPGQGGELCSVEALSLLVVHPENPAHPGEPSQGFLRSGAELWGPRIDELGRA